MRQLRSLLRVVDRRVTRGGKTPNEHSSKWRAYVLDQYRLSLKADPQALARERAIAYESHQLLDSILTYEDLLEKYGMSSIPNQRDKVQATARFVGLTVPEYNSKPDDES
eukprot:Rmarinus@m.20442